MAVASAPLRVAARRAVLFRLHPSILLCVFVGFLFFFRLGHRDLYSSHEARAAQNAQRMLDTGEWGLPVLFDGQTDLQKPPGYYWLVAAVGWLNGGVVDAWAARLPAATAGLLTVLMVFAFLRREGRPVAAVIAAVGLATAIHFTAIARTARIDVPLSCAVTAALLAFYRGLSPSPRRGEGGERSESGEGVTVQVPLTSDPSPRGGEGRIDGFAPWHFLAAVAGAAGVMLKGPVALALIGPAAVAVLFTARNPTRCNGWGLLPSSVVLGILTVLGLSLPWFVWANRATDGEFFRIFFWHHNVERFAGTSPTLASHPWWYYGPRFTADFLPWTPALAGVLWWAVRSGRWRDDHLFRFGVVWCLVMFAVLSAAKFKRSDYLLPLYPGAAIAFGCAAEAWFASRTNPRTVKVAKWAFGLTAACAAVGWQVMTFVIEPAEQAREEKRAFAAVIREQAPAPNEVMLFRAESHLLAYHLGRPLLTRVEWHDLNDWLAEPGPHFVVMPPEYVYPAQQIVRSRKLAVVARLEDYTPAQPPRPLVFLRTAD